MNDSRLSRIALYVGLYSRVAEQLGVDPSHVRRVALGQRRSVRIETALLSELDRIEAMSMGDLHIRPATLDRQYVEGKQFAQQIQAPTAQTKTTLWKSLITRLGAFIPGRTRV